MSKSANARGYTYRWQRERIQFLRAHPLCAMCEAEGKLTPSDVVDHIDAHKGDQEKFWDARNWQALCKPCHDGTKQRMERGGPIIGCDEHGIPLDPGSAWRK